MLEKQKLLQILKKRQVDLETIVNSNQLKAATNGDSGRLSELTNLINSIEAGMFDISVWE